MLHDNFLYVTFKKYSVLIDMRTFSEGSPWLMAGGNTAQHGYMQAPLALIKSRD